VFETITFQKESAPHSMSLLVAVCFLYLSAAVCGARGVWALVLGRWVSPKLVGGGAWVAVVLGSTLPYLLTLETGCAGAESWFGNIVGFMEEYPTVSPHLTYACVAALVAYGVFLVPCVRAFRMFKRPEPKETEG
jgi:hypothetical protein